MSIKRAQNEGWHETKKYNLYCINYHGSCLNSIKNEFKKQILTGLRRHIFIIDLEELQHNLDGEPRTSKLARDYAENPQYHLKMAILKQIQDFRREYDAVTKQISDELKFDLYQYWLKDIEENVMKSMVDGGSSKGVLTATNTGASKARQRISTSKTNKSIKSSKNTLGTTADDTEIKCFSLQRREHNRVGQKEQLSKRKYIKDDPTDAHLYIIIMGCMSEQLYEDLRRLDQPIQAIINFVPIESSYYILVNTTSLRNFIAQTLEEVNASINRLRQKPMLKTVGIFANGLPIISECSATKYYRDIFDQLSWCLYDIEILQQQYYNYYYQPFQETDVNLPSDVDLRQLYHIAASLSLHGFFQKKSLCGTACDVATVSAFLDSLLNTCALPDNLLNEKDVLLLSVADFTTKLPKKIKGLARSHRSAFVSITKIRKFERLFVEDCNKVLVNMLQYAEQDRFKNLYLACLDYNQWRNLKMSVKLRPSLAEYYSNYCKLTFTLPAYVKYYASEDSCHQQLMELCRIYNEYRVREIKPGYKLYTFLNRYNAISEHEQVEVIPTRLCFRDFSLFQVEEFLSDLKTPELSNGGKLEGRTSSESLRRKSKTLELDDNIYIRPTSLKFTKLNMEKSNESQTQTQRDKEQKSNRKRNTIESKTPVRNSLEWVGLPPGHQLLKGYNLEDIRQEIKTNTSKYFFHHGCIQLYEEKWCFKETNQSINFDICNCKIYLNRPRSEDKGVLNNIRLETIHRIQIRILNETLEHSKIVINYPNGLSIYYHEIYCEQVWSAENLFENETRRIFTPYGAVIVYYYGDYLITIMRYNGEVYRLYQYETPEEEEEEQGMLSKFSNKTSWETFKDQGDVRSSHTEKKEKDDRKFHKGQGDSLKFNLEVKTESIKEASEEPIKVDPQIALKASIEFELSYLELIVGVYGLSYVSLKLTTSQGKRIHQKMNGEIYENSPCKLEEWHDYQANESYSQRSDGVKMIWSRENLKCYHKDKTLITTRTEECYESLDNDEFEIQISESSSHQFDENEEKEDDGNLIQHNSAKYQDFLTAEEAEEIEDNRFVNFTCSNWLIQHAKYAGVYFLWTTIMSPSQYSVLMEIFANDNVTVYINREKEKFETTSGEENAEETTMETEKNLVNVRVGENLHITIDQEGLEIFAVMERYRAEDVDAIINDSLTLKILFQDCLKNVFEYLTKKIATFQNYHGVINKELYFIEVRGKNGKTMGFEFFEDVPKTNNYTYKSGNSWVETQALKTADELMIHSIDGFEKDMNKFPRFCTRSSQNAEPEFPLVLKASTCFQIPAQLRTIKNIAKFLEPFEETNFKSLRPKFKQILDVHLKPQIQMALKYLYSTNNWIKRKREHSGRLFIETQRIGLYHAMLKHNKYPNYFKFTHDYRSDVADIDFFEFMQSKCENQTVKREEVYWPPRSSFRRKQYANPMRASDADDCLHGTYDK